MTQCSERNQALLDAGFLFEKARGLPQAGMGWSKAVIDASITNVEIERLKAALVEFVEQGGDGLWSLSKCDDQGLKPLFIRVLQHELDGDSGKLYQTMIALDNLGEKVFGRRGSYGVLDVDENRKCASEYLKSLPE